MRQIITFILIFFSIDLIAQGKFVAHDYINGNIPSYKPTFQESFQNGQSYYTKMRLIFMTYNKAITIGS